MNPIPAWLLIGKSFDALVHRHAKGFQSHRHQVVLADREHDIHQLLRVVPSVDASGKVQGRARLAFRFDQLDIAGDHYEIRSDTVSYTADRTRAEDAKKIGIGAGAGALIGGLLGGKKGAGAGAAIGGGAGTAVVLTTAGEEVRLGSGTPVEVTLAQALVLLIPLRL